jgi:hypothetical protein
MKENNNKVSTIILHSGEGIHEYVVVERKVPLNKNKNW